jgi:transcriptional regulator with XRE-family HTH domain
MSQEKLAEKVGASRPNVVAWEKGRSFPLVDRLPLIARALDCTIDELFELDSDEEGGES